MKQVLHVGPLSTHGLQYASQYAADALDLLIRDAIEERQRQSAGRSRFRHRQPGTLAPCRIGRLQVNGRKVPSRRNPFRGQIALHAIAICLREARRQPHDEHKPAQALTRKIDRRQDEV